MTKQLLAVAAAAGSSCVFAIATQAASIYVDFGEPSGGSNTNTSSPASTGALGRTGSVRATHETASLNTSGSTRNFICYVLSASTWW